MTEEQIFERFQQFMLTHNPGIACGLKMRRFIEDWVAYKIDRLPMLNAVKDKTEQEFSETMKFNFPDQV